jgi:hypothetical protein
MRTGEIDQKSLCDVLAVRHGLLMHHTVCPLTGARCKNEKPTLCMMASTLVAFCASISRPW